MRAFTIRGVRLGAIDPLLIPVHTQVQVTAAAAQAAAAANSNADIPQASLALNYGYAPASIGPVGTSTSTSKLPWILGGLGVVVLGVGAYFLLRKKGRR